MYPVSEAFLQAVQENARRYYWTGRITTKNGIVHEFDENDIVKGSGYISSQCCGSTEIELGTVYSSELGITLLSEIERYTLEDALIEVWYHLLVNGSYETVPMGIFEISEANRSIKCLEIKAYDYMLRLDKNFNVSEVTGTAYEIISMCCKACKVTLAHTQAEISAWSNAQIVLSLYAENDIETYRDVLRFSGGHADEAQITCVTSSQIKIGGKHKLKCVGKNPKLAQLKSRNDKNISGLLNQVEAGKVGEDE